ncbi:MAG: NAD(P)-dependent oxidoreductase [Thermodesulfobacteriota bacterium]
MTTLVAGASGATGRLLVEELLNRGQDVRAIVRSPDKLSATHRNHGRLLLIEAGVLEIGDAEMARHVDGCDAVASCLGHNLNGKGIYGQPRRLVTDAVRRLCHAIKANKPEKPVRFVLMNTAGNSNRDLNETPSRMERCAMGLIRLLLPPHADNEQAADYLRIEIGRNDAEIQWAVVRPDTLIDENRVIEYEVYPSPTRSALFNPGRTSRINVGRFMADLITDDAAWKQWQGRMPVIYNREIRIQGKG